MNTVNKAQAKIPKRVRAKDFILTFSSKEKNQFDLFKEEFLIACKTHLYKKEQINLIVLTEVTSSLFPNVATDKTQYLAIICFNGTADFYHATKIFSFMNNSGFVLTSLYKPNEGEAKAFAKDIELAVPANLRYYQGKTMLNYSSFLEQSA